MAWTPQDEDFYQQLSRMDFSTPAKPPAQSTSALGDAATALKVGVQKVPGAVTGLLDIPVAAVTGRPMVSEGWGELGKLTGFQPGKWADESTRAYSPAQQQFEQEAAQKDGFWETAGHYASNPLRAGVKAVESLPGMVAGGALGRAKALSGLGGYARAGIGEGAIMAGQSMEQLTEQGVDPRRAAAASAGVGVLGGFIGGGMSKVAGKMGLSDVDVLFAGGGRAVTEAGKRPLGLARRVAGGTFSEGVLEEMPQSAMEATLGNWAAERPLGEGVGQAAGAGLVLGGLMGGVMNIPGARKPIDATRPAGEQAPAPAPATDLFGGGQSADPDAAAEPRAPEDILAEYRYFADLARGGQNHPQVVEQATAELKRLSEELKAAGVSQHATSPENAAKRLAKIETEHAKLNTQFEEALLTSPEKASGLYTKMQALRAEQAMLQQLYPVQDDAQGDLFGDTPAAQTPKTFGTAFSEAGGRNTKLRDQLNNAQSVDEVLEITREALERTNIASSTVKAMEALHLQVAGVSYADWKTAQETNQGVAQNGSEETPVPAEGQQQGAPVREGQAGVEGAPVQGQAEPVRGEESPAVREEGLTEEERLAAGWTRVVRDGQEQWVAPKAPEQEASAPAPSRNTEARRGRYAGVEPPPRPTANATPERKARYAAQLREYLDNVVASLPPPVTEALREVSSGFGSELDIAGVVMNARQQLVEEYAAKNGGSNPTPYAMREIDEQVAALKQQLDGNAGDTSTASLRVAARKLGVSHETVRQRVLQGMAAVQAAAERAGLAPETAFELLKLKPETVELLDTVTEAEAAQMGLSYRADKSRARRNVAESDEFDETYGMERTEGAETDTTAEGEQVVADNPALVDARTAIGDEQTAPEREVDTTQPIDMDQLEAAAQEVERVIGADIRPSQTGQTVEDAAAEWEDRRRTRAGGKADPEWVELLPQQKTEWINAFFRWDEGVLDDKWFDDKRGRIADAAFRRGEADAARNGQPARGAGEEVSGRGAQDTDQQGADRPAPAREAAREDQGIDPSEQGAEEGLTAEEMARQWDAAAQDAGLPVFEALSAAQRDYILGSESAEEFAEAANEVATEIATDAVVASDVAGFGDGAQLSQAPATRGTTLDAVWAAVDEIVGPQGRRRITVVQSADELVARKILPSRNAGVVQGYVKAGHAYFIADNIRPGNERAVFLHEIGAHLGLEKTLSGSEFRRLVSQVKGWADKQDGSLEARLANAAIGRVAKAGTPARQRDQELVAYFIEEAVRAGVDPTAQKLNTPVARWLRSLWTALRAALQKLGLVNPKALTAQDVVDLAAGAARVTTGATSEEGQFSIADTVTAGAIAAAPEAARPSIKAAQVHITEAVRKGRELLMFTEDLVRQATASLPSAAAWYEQLSRREQTRVAHKAKVDEIGTAFDQLDRDQFTRTWKAIHDMTTSQKWGYQPTWRDAVQIDPVMETQYEALTATERELVDRVFRHGDETQGEIQKILDDIVNGEYETALKAARTDEARAKIEKQYGQFRKLYGRKLAKLDGPYAPKRRVGSHTVVAKSQAYLDAEERGEHFELRDKPEHYRVEFYDSQAQAAARADELQGRYARVIPSVKEVTNDQEMLPFEAFDQIRKMIASDGRDGAKEASTTVKKLSNLVTELYLVSLAETSARKSEMRRHNPAGMEVEEVGPDAMYRAFLAKGSADAHYIGTLQNGRTVAETYAQMRREANDPKKGDRNLKRRLFNELTTRYENSVRFEDSSTVGKLLNFSSIWMLLTKPAYFVYNATQPLMLTQPALAQTHGYAKSFAAMMKAYTEVVELPSFTSKGSLDLHSLPEDVREDVIRLRDMGRIDITLTQDLGDRIHGARGTVGRGWQWAERTLKGFTQKVEMTNRVVSAIAALRLAREADTADPVRYASKIIYDTHGDYSNLNAPRAFNHNSALRVMTQFRKFQFIQIGQLVRMFNAAKSGATLEEKWALSRALRFTLAHHAVLAGAMGLPAMSVIAWAFSALGDDDEPRDLELTLTKMIGDETAAKLLMHGLPALANLNMTSNVGMGQTFSILPFADVSFGERGGYEKAVTALTGPLIGGFGLQAWDALGAMGKGDYYKGLEGLLPSGLRAASKAFREASEGVTNRKGDVLVAADEIDAWATGLKLMGFRTEDDAMRQMVRGAQFEFERAFSERTSTLKKQYTEAYRDGDAAAMREARENWVQMQQHRRLLGFRPQPVSNLLRAPREQKKRERQTAGGVQYDAGSKKFVLDAR